MRPATKHANWLSLRPAVVAQALCLCESIPARCSHTTSGSRVAVPAPLAARVIVIIHGTAANAALKLHNMCGICGAIGDEHSL